MVLSEKNNYCINEETSKAGSTKENWQLSISWVGEVDLMEWGPP